jgi:ankyrin repeat protein
MRFLMMALLALMFLPCCGGEQAPEDDAAAPQEEPPQPPDPEVQKALREAIREGDVNRVRELLDQGEWAPGLDVECDGRTALHEAASKGEMEIVKLLVERGYSLAADDDSGDTPLHTAASLGHMEIVAFFISKGVDPDVAGPCGVAPLHRLATGGSELDMLKAAWERHSSGEGPDERLAVADFLIRKGAKVNAKDIRGMTPLHHAARAGSQEMVEFLIHNGAEVNARDSAGWTPLDMVEDKVLQQELLEYLRSCGAVSGKDLDDSRDE